MNQKERLVAVLAKKSVDRAPFICPGGMMSMIVTDVMEEASVYWPQAHSDPELMAQLTLAANRAAGVENVGVPFCMTVEAEALGALVELGSRENEPRVVGYPLDSLAELHRLAPLDLTRGRVQVCIEAVRRLRQLAPDLPVIANVTGPLSLATSLVEPLVYYRALRKDREGAHRLTELATQCAVLFGEALVEAGADVVCIADPSATGEIIGAQAFADFALPYLNRMTERFRAMAVPTIMHVCGNVKSLGGTLAGLSAEALSVDSVVGIGLLKELAPEKVSMGNVSTYLLEKGAAGAVCSAGKACLAAGVDILAPACGIGPRTPLANVRALARAVES